MSFTTYALLAAQLWNVDAGSLIIGSLAASYGNAGNLGIAVAAYVIGDVAAVVPTLLVQMLVVQPLAMAALDRTTGRGGQGMFTALRRLVMMPLTTSAILGFGLALTGWQLPTSINGPLELVAGASIPLMLIVYGAALRSSPPPGQTGHNREVTAIALSKLVVMPAIAYMVGTAMGAEGNVLRGIVLTAALPTAQIVFLHATRYRAGQAVARESIMVTTVLSLPVTFVLALVLT